MKDLVIILGSGASYGSGYQHKVYGIAPPTDFNFFKALPKNVREEYPAINFLYGKQEQYGKKSDSLEVLWSIADVGYKLRSNDVVYDARTLKILGEFVANVFENDLFSFEKKIDELNYEYLSNCIDKGIRRADIKSNESRYHFLTGELGRELITLISKMYDTSEHQLVAKEDSYEVLFKKTESRLLGIINFNYDLFAQKSLRRLGIDASSLAYFHGCLGWVERWGRASEAAFECPKVLNEIMPVFEKDRYVQPAILPPVVLKTFPEEKVPKTFIPEIFYRSNFPKVTRIKQERSRAEEWLRKALEIWFIGYSLPSADEHSITFFREMFERTDPKITICTAKNSKVEETYSKRLLLKNKPIIFDDGFSEFVKSINLKV